MRPDQIKIKRTESLLRELIPEAIAILRDDELGTIGVVDVVCRKGKYDAEVFLDPAYSNDENERKKVIKLLKVYEQAIEAHCLASTGWYRCPKLRFKFDETTERAKRLDEIFKKIQEGSSNV